MRKILGLLVLVSLEVTVLAAVAISRLAFAQCRCLSVNVEYPSCCTAMDEEAIYIKTNGYPSAGDGVSHERGVGPLCGYEWHCWCNAGRLCCKVYICWYDSYLQRTFCQPSGPYECFGSCDDPTPVHDPNPIMI